MKRFTIAAPTYENYRTMNMHNIAMFKSLELFDWDPNFFDDDMDFLNPESTQTAKSTQHNLLSNNKTEYPSQESTSNAFSTQTTIASTQDNFSQNNKMECSSQESMSSANNMDISSQESQEGDKMHISSQETSLDKLEVSSKLKTADEAEFPFVAANDPSSRMDDVCEQCGMNSSYKTDHFPQSVSRNVQNARNSSPKNETAEEIIPERKETRFYQHEIKSSSHEAPAYKTKNLSCQGSSYNIGTFDQDAKNQSMSVSELISSEKSEIAEIGMNISSSRKVANLTEPILNDEKRYPKISSENMGTLSIVNREDRGREISPLNEEYKVQSSIDFCTEEKTINCEAMSISSQESSGSQTMDISSQETIYRNEEVVFKANNSKKREIPQSVERDVKEPFPAKKRCCCKGFQVQKSVFNIRKKRRAVMKRENALKKREARIAEREASVLRREEDLKAREQRILNYEAALFRK